ncbi:MAG: HAD family hydrolase [Clostridiales bacterium]|nr:HAD family hydrolase [Clostridiales bacterium]
MTGSELKKLFGKPLDEIMRILLPDISEDERNSIMQECFMCENEWVATKPCLLYEGMIEGIKRLSEDFSLFIVSNCQSGYIEAFLEATGLSEFIKDFTCPGETGQLKAENIKLIMERNQVQTAVYVGDTFGDMEAAKTAGIPFIYAKYGFGEVATYDGVIEEFSDLLKFDYNRITF